MIDSPLAFPSGAYGHPGMTLRDYFAAKTMQAMLGSNWTLKDERYLQGHTRWLT